MMDFSKVKRSEYTPMMQQYLELKDSYMDSIVFTRIGDFYEMFFDDAILASKELELALTGKDCGISERVPMCGIPFHAYEPYALKLVEKGYKVVIVEQMEDPSLAKGIVKRDVVKIFTPGTLNLNGMDGKVNNFLASVTVLDKNFVLGYSDITTGEGYLTILSSFDSLVNEIQSLKIKELLIPSNFYPKYKQILSKTYNVLLTIYETDEIKPEFNHIIDNLPDSTKKTYALILNYAFETQRMELPHFKKCFFIEKESFLKLDSFSRRNLELTETLRNGSRVGSLLNLLDKCETAMGSRMMFRYLNRPLIDIKAINERLDYVESFKDNYLVRASIKELLKNVYDLERIVGRIASNSANAKDLVWLRRSLSVIPSIKDELESTNIEAFIKLSDKLDSLDSLYDVLQRAFVDNPPLSVKDGEMIKDGYSELLDSIKNEVNCNKEWLINYEASEKERTGLKNLKVGYNRVFGYYIEVSKGQAKEFTDLGNYERKQTLANAERYISSELKEHETLLLGAHEKIINLEYELFTGVRELCLKNIESIQHLADELSTIDVYISLAMVASTNNYVRPRFSNNREINIVNGRHPVIESYLEKTYVCNDIVINKFNTVLITGPNMSGKSTYMRQLAITAIMAQIGSFVPADSALLCIFDQIFTRIGASDDLTSGQSTFMVEMMEANYALQNATKNSLILFDEIGRGTATYDGMALAQAIIEYTHEKIGCITLFSTHYHELVELEKTLKHLKNVHVSAKEDKKGVVFLHKVLDGPTDKSYGINVAELARLPKPLIERSKEILKALEETKGKAEIDLNLFDFNIEEVAENNIDKEKEDIISDLENLDLNLLTPLDCLNILSNWQKRLK